MIRLPEFKCLNKIIIRAIQDLTQSKIGLLDKGQNCSVCSTSVPPQKFYCITVVHLFPLHRNSAHKISQEVVTINGKETRPTCLNLEALLMSGTSNKHYFHDNHYQCI